MLTEDDKLTTEVHNIRGSMFMVMYLKSMTIY